MTGLVKTLWAVGGMAMLVSSCTSTRRAPRAMPPVPERIQSPSQYGKQSVAELKVEQEEPIPGREITVAWDGNPEAENVVGYWVYIGDQQIAEVSEATATLEDLKWEDVHTISVTAYNAAGESERSKPVEVSPLPLIIEGEIVEGEMLITVNGWPGAVLDMQISGDMIRWNTIGTVILDREGKGSYTADLVGRRGFWRVVSR